MGIKIELYSHILKNSPRTSTVGSIRKLLAKRKEDQILPQHDIIRII